MQKPGDLLVPVPAGLVWNGFVIVYTERSHLYGFHPAQSLRIPSKNALLAYVASGFQPMKITAGTYHISGGVYGGYEEILACDAPPLNYNACMGIQLTVFPIKCGAAHDDA